MAVSCATDTPPCLQMQPSVNVIYTDVWTTRRRCRPPTSARRSLQLHRSDAIRSRIPTTALCETTWSSNCLIIINYPEHIQPMWDAVRPVTVNGAQVSEHLLAGRLPQPVTPSGTAQTPAGNLDLTSSVSNTTPHEFTSYVQLLFPHNTVIMGQPGPTVGPFMNAGSANGGPVARSSSRMFGSNGQHAGWLNAGRSFACCRNGWILAHSTSTTRSTQPFRSTERVAPPRRRAFRAAPPPRCCWHGC